MTTSDLYTKAGVNIEAGNEVVSRIKNIVAKTHNEAVLTGIGSFGALYDLKEIIKNYNHPVLVQSIDGVGTKLIIAEMLEQNRKKSYKSSENTSFGYESIGMDLVNHSCNDIVVMGAKPLTILDYIANEKLNPDIVESLVTGMAKACIENDISLIGGETAEMPGIYLQGQHDLAACITGIVEKDQIITGESIVVGDAVLGFASNGLHTNGYSLARKIFFEDHSYTVDTVFPELNTNPTDFLNANQDSHTKHSQQGHNNNVTGAKIDKTLGEHLLAVHTNYTKPILNILNRQYPSSGSQSEIQKKYEPNTSNNYRDSKKIRIKGLAHITGGGFIDNIPRILPQHCGVLINKGSWPVLPIFELMQKLGSVSELEMYRTFNMGIGMVMVVDPAEVKFVRELMNETVYEVGKVIARDNDSFSVFISN